MVRWYHLIMPAYGFWLPNDPRGSWSEFVGSWELYKFGPATKTNEKRSLAHDPHDVYARLNAKRALKYPPARFDARQRHLIGAGFEEAVREADYQMSACCVGYDHAHAVVSRHERSVERIAGHLKSKATMSLKRANSHPLRDFRKFDGTTPTPWAEGCWNVFINDIEHLHAAIVYVQRHPMKEGLDPQTWSFVVPPNV